ncbi:superinfection exclusion B family protein [Halosquirtibacter laminarini]|uniref:Superinfection exclusion B family protein n=1 Tax=Halosquirtibacter laminarini TaxID=3374600 RepID=A0AC61NI46_9BACT|nr:superinfection exclusion B family protein [Prolixibacteraceae bacterium]
MEWLKNLIDLDKISNTTLFIIMAITALKLFYGEIIFDFFNISSIDPKYNLYIFIAFVVSTLILLIRFGKYIKQKLKVFYNKRKYKRKLKKTIKSLDPHEKSLIREFFLLGSKSIKMPINDPTVSGLLSKGIIHTNTVICTSQFGEFYSNYSLNDQILENLTYEIIDFPKAFENLTEDDWVNLKNNRPAWAKRLHEYDSILNSF